MAGAGAVPAERRARMLLSAVVEPGDPDACRLVREHSGRLLVERLRTGGLSTAKGRCWAERLACVEAEEVLAAASRVDARYLVPDDHEWPLELTDLRWLETAAGERRAGEPFGLWVRGRVRLSDVASRAVAIVGARAATPYGEHVSGALAGGCATHGLVVVSGGAYGIDAAAHRGALAVDRPTVAVLASGIDRLYPVAHGGLLREIADQGLLVSEAAPGCPPSRSRFLVRNRLIAALTRGTVVVEAALRSGSLNTARWARDLGRLLMGVPGPVTSMMSGGVHEMLRQPDSVLVTDAEEVIDLVAPIGAAPAPDKHGPVAERDMLDADLRRVLDATPVVAAAPTGSIATMAGLAPSQAVALLGRLADLGLVLRVGNGWRLPPRSDDAP
jgi:DNA processing protein